MVLDIGREFFLRLSEELAYGIYYADISLVEEVMADRIGIDAQFIQCPRNILTCRLDSKLEHILSLHLKRNILLFLSDVGSRMEQPVLPQLVSGAGGR